MSDHDNKCEFMLAPPDMNRLGLCLCKERALKARLAEAERDIAQWKKVYDLRGRALQRPCINCGHVPLVIHADAARATDSASVLPEVHRCQPFKDIG